MATQLHAFHCDVKDEAFGSFLRTLRARRCVRKEDRVYRVLGLVGEAIRREIPVRYHDDTDNYHLAYRSAGKVLLERVGLDALLRDASLAGKPAGVPSWCPDWSLPTVSGGLSSFALAGHPQRLRPSCYIDPLHLSWVVVNGVCIDRISAVNDTYAWYWPQDVAGEDGPAHKMLEWLDSCIDMTRQCGIAHNDAQRVCWETLCGDVPGRNANKRVTFHPDLETGFQALKKRLDKNRKSLPIAETKSSPQERAALMPLLS